MGLADLIALQAVAAKLLEQLDLAICLNALRYAGHIQIVAQIHQMADDRLLTFAVLSAADEAAVDLHVLDLRQIQHLETRGFCSHIVQRQRDAPRAQRVKKASHALKLYALRAFRNFKCQPLWICTGLSKDLVHRVQVVRALPA